MLPPFPNDDPAISVDVLHAGADGGLQAQLERNQRRCRWLHLLRSIIGVRHDAERL
jgi:hypothetical protein